MGLRWMKDIWVLAQIEKKGIASKEERKESMRVKTKRNKKGVDGSSLVLDERAMSK